jgi:hypothetical protein
MLDRTGRLDPVEGNELRAMGEARVLRDARRHAAQRAEVRTGLKVQLGERREGGERFERLDRILAAHAQDPELWQGGDPREVRASFQTGPSSSAGEEA